MSERISDETIAPLPTSLSSRSALPRGLNSASRNTRPQSPRLAGGRPFRDRPPPTGQGAPRGPRATAGPGQKIKRAPKRRDENREGYRPDDGRLALARKEWNNSLPPIPPPRDLSMQGLFGHQSLLFTPPTKHESLGECFQQIPCSPAQIVPHLQTVRIDPSPMV